VKPPLNILDHLADCAEVSYEYFPGDIERQHVDGAHGQSSTTALLIKGDDGFLYRVSYERVTQ